MTQRINLNISFLRTTKLESGFIYFLHYKKWVILTALVIAGLMSFFMSFFNIKDTSELTVTQSILSGAVGSSIATFFTFSLFTFRAQEKSRTFLWSTFESYFK